MAAPTLDIDPWLVREPHVDPGAVAVAESVFSLSNGCVGIRGTLDGVEPHGMRGTYLSGVDETHPLSYPEGGYGHPEERQTLVTVADGTPLRLLVDGVPLDVREVRPQLHERTLDLRAGTLDRRVRWTALSGTTAEVSSRRVVSLAERSVRAVRYEVRALDGPAHVVVRRTSSSRRCCRPRSRARPISSPGAAGCSASRPHGRAPRSRWCAARGR